MDKVEVTINKELNEQVFSTVLNNGLQIHICKKEGFKKKIGMFGTKYGSINNDFVDISTNERIKVPDGIAHFLEHKLFEQEGANALDLFSKIGVTSNAYTSFDHTVYFFETIDRFEESLELLVKLIKTPYFTDENLQKEQGIIAQEIKMYNDDPNFSGYFNTLRAMYNVHPVRIDIAGTVESISNITKDLLYTCYNTFYSPQNMFVVIVGDVDVESTINLIKENIKLYEKDFDNKKQRADVQKFIEEEPLNIAEKEIVQNMEIYMPQLFIGYKLEKVAKDEIIKRKIICDIISDMYFSKMSDFYEQEYNKGIINEEIGFDFEGVDSFSHVIISANSIDIDTLKTDLINYIDKIKNEEIDENLFELIKKRHIGNEVRSSDSLSKSYRRIIDSILTDIEIYLDDKILNNLTKEDVKNFLNLLDNEKRVFSIIEQK